MKYVYLSFKCKKLEITEVNSIMMTISLGVFPANKTERLDFITSWIHNQPDIFTSLLNPQPNSVEEI